MKKRYESIAIATIIVLAVVVAGVASYDLLSPHNTQGQQSTTNSFVQQPVVDVIIPQLFRQQGSDSGNAPLNITRGGNVTLSIDIYPTVSLTLRLEYEVYPLSVSSLMNTSRHSSTVLAIFDPQSFSVASGDKGVSTMHLRVLTQAQIGQYNAVVTVVDVNNSTQTWGDIFQINVLGQ